MHTSPILEARRDDRALLVAALGAVALLAAAALAAWDASPYGRYLSHEGGAGGGVVLEAALFGAGWLLMIAAMMLPTTIPLVAAFAALVSRRAGRGRLVGLLLAGYVVTWTAFGIAAYVFDRVVHVAVAQVPLLAAYPQLVIASTLAVAGAWQFSALKYRCLEECRAPLPFVLARWRGVSPALEAVRLGIAHGIFCIGCCWSVMLVMFGVGMGNLAWMFAFGALMAVEKNVTWGRRVSRPLGVALLVAALATVSL